MCKAQDPLSDYAYFFFDSRNADNSLLLFEKLLRSLLSQLSFRCGGVLAALKESYDTHGDGHEQPSAKSIHGTLQRVMEGFDHVYIMIDALDECADRVKLLQWIETMAKWKSDRLHLLLTSRLEPDITRSLESLTRPVRFEASALKRDIGVFLEAQFSSIPDWNDDTRALVKTTLIEDADGMYVAVASPA